MKKEIILLLMSLIVLSFSCSDELIKNDKQDSKPKITLGLVSENNNGGRTEAVIVQPTSGTFYTGNTMNITWSFLTCLCGDWTSSNINIELYKGSNSVMSIATNVPFVDANYNSQYNWIIPAMVSTGSNFKIRITNSSNSSQYADSDNISLVTPDDACYYSHWSLGGIPGSNVSNNSTISYQVVEDGLATLALANAPYMRVISYGSINITYNGNVYSSSGPSGVVIPINSSVGCSGSNPSISVPLTFQRISTYSVYVNVYIYGVSSGHYFNSGYHGFTLN